MLGSLFLLLLTLASSAYLSFSALERAQMTLLFEEYTLAGRETAAQIEDGLRFGRPLGQFIGLEEILDTLRVVPGVTAVGVTDAEGAPLGDWASDLEYDQVAGIRAAARDLLESMSAEQARSAEPVVDGTQRYFLTPLQGRGDTPAGVLVLTVLLAELASAREQAVADAVTAMLAISVFAAALLAVAAGRLRGAMLRQRSGKPAARWRWIMVPMIILLSAQTAYATFVLKIMRTNLTVVSEAGAARMTHSVGDDLERLLSLGIGFDRMPGLDTLLSDALTLNNTVETLEILDQSGTPQVRVDRAPDVTTGWLFGWMPVPQAGHIVRELPGRDGSPAGQLVAHINTTPIAAGLADQVIRMLTVAATSAFVMIELFILLQIVLSRAVRRGGKEPTISKTTTQLHLDHSLSHAEKEAPHIAARPVMFAFVLSWALPLSFLPLKMRSLGEQLWGLPPELVLALPISAEMGAALLMAVLAGRLADRVGWARPFMIGLALSALGGVGAALAPDSASFILARSVTGLGYGLAWMGLQAFVVQTCPAEKRGQALANLMAGILAGFLVGTAIGGIMAEQFGRNMVLWATGFMVLAPLTIALVTLRPFLRGPTPPSAVHGPDRQDAPQAGWAPLLRSPAYMAVLILSVVPFSIAQVGLLYFVVPLHLDRMGAAASDAGRILMVYGIVVILFGPMLSRLIDQSRLKAPIVVAGGLVGGLGLTLLVADLGLAGIFLAAMFLSLSSTLIEPARAAFVLGLPAVQAVGPSSALGMQRAADKLGQMVGPVAIAIMLPSSDMMRRVAALGLGFAAASLLLAAVIMWRRPGNEASAHV